MIKKRSTIARLQRIGHISTTALLLGSFVGVSLATPLINVEQVQAAGLADVSILQGASLTSNGGTNLSPNSAGDYDLSLTYAGTGLANVGLADKKILVFALPPELQGKVKGGAQVKIDAQLLPITPGDVPAVKPLLATLKTAVGALADAAKLLGANIDSVEKAIADLEKAKDIGSYSETLPATVSPDGKSISVDFTDGLGKYVGRAYGDLFHPLRDAINGLKFEGILSSLNTLLTPVKSAANALFNVTDAIGNGTSTVLNEAIHANILGHTSGTLTTTVSDPHVSQATVAAAAVNNAAVDIGLISSGGSQVTLHFKGSSAEDPLKDYTVAKPTIDKVNAGDTKVTGAVTLTKPIPDGTKFEAIVSLPDGSTQKAEVDENGKYSITIPAAKAGDKLSVLIEASNGDSKKQSEAAETEVGGQTTEDPLKDYTVAKPTIDKVTAGDTKVTGQVTLTQPIPAGTKFEAIVTRADGSTEKASVDEDGKYSITIPAAKAGEKLSVVIEASNGDSKKQSEAAETEVGGQTAEDPLKDYTVAKPAVDKVTAGDTKVTGEVNLTKPIPEGTKFEAIVTMPDGTKAKATVDADGKYNITIPEAKAGDKLSVVIEASNGDSKKQSEAAETEVAAKTAEDPLKDYTVAKPTVDKVTAGDTKVTGEVNLTKPIPDGTKFEAIVTLPDGTTKKAEVDADGKYSITIPAAKAGDKLSVVVEASNGDSKKQSDAAETEVASKTAEDPLKDYTVAKPAVDKVTAGDTKVTGQVILGQPVPEGTKFEAIVTLPDGTKAKATVDADGKYNVTIPVAKTGDKLSVVIEASNGDSKKQSDPTETEVAAKTAEDPLKDYTVAKPDIDKVTAGDTKVTGEVKLTKPIPDGTKFEAIVTLPDGSTKKATVDDNGKYSVTIPEAKAGDKLSVVVEASNGDSKKQSAAAETEVVAKATENPLKDYNVTKPSVDPVTAGDTKVTGQVTLAQPIPDGTKFEAIVTLPDGSTKKATVDDNGKYSVTIPEAKAGDKLNVVIEASNGDNKKQSDPADVEVAAKATENPLKDYNVAKPSVDAVKAGDTKVTGQVTLAKPVPEGTTFEAIVTLPDGSQKRAKVDADGRYSITIPAAKKGDKLSVVIEAKNGDSKRQSEAAETEVVAKTAEDPLKDYNVAKPSIDKVTAGDEKVTGKVTLTRPIPADTDFMAIVTLPDGTTKQTKVDADGNYSITIPAAKAGDQLSVVIEAKNGDSKKQSEAAETKVAAKATENPLKDYTVGKPTIDKVTAGDTEIKGTVDLAKPIPDGTKFEAIVTLPDGSKQTAKVDADGHFTVKVDPVKAGDKLKVAIEATNGDDKKLGATTDVEVAAKTAEDPLKDYHIGQPSINPVTAGDKEITGTVDLGKPIPDGTKFEAIVTLPDGSKQTAQVDADGHFTIKVDPVKAGDKLSVIVEATNGDSKKQSAATTIEVAAKNTKDPLKDYTVGQPSVDPVKAGDDTVKGSINLGKIPQGTNFEVIVTLPNRTQKKAKVGSDGKFKVKVGALEADDKLSVVVVATNGQSTKRSRVTNVTVGQGTTKAGTKTGTKHNPLAGHQANKPTINQIKAGDKTVTGRVIHRNLPKGTNVGVVGALTDGTRFSGTVDGDGYFRAHTRTLAAGEKVAMASVLTNGDHQQRGTTETATVGAPGGQNQTPMTPNSGYGQTNPKANQSSGFLPQTDEMIRSGAIIGIVGLLTAGAYALYRWFKR